MRRIDPPASSSTPKPQEIVTTPKPTPVPKNYLDSVEEEILTLVNKERQNVGLSSLT